MWIVWVCEIGYPLFDSSPTVVVFEDAAHSQSCGGAVSWYGPPSGQTLQLIVAQTWDTGAVGAEGPNTCGVTKQTKGIAQKPSSASSVIAYNWITNKSPHDTSVLLIKPTLIPKCCGCEDDVKDSFAHAETHSCLLSVSVPTLHWRQEDISPGYCQHCHQLVVKDVSLEVTISLIKIAQSSEMTSCLSNIAI